MARKLADFSHVKASRILFVAGEARRGSRATIRPLAGSRISLKGKRALYCITLRPKFFRASTPEQRVETLLHELLHVSAAFDGKLHGGRRHSVLSKAKFEALLRPLPGNPPYELADVLQLAVDAGVHVSAIQVGPTRDLTSPADVVRENFPYLR